MTQRKCEMPGCERKHLAQGLCAGHYRELRYYGVLDVMQLQAPDGEPLAYYREHVTDDTDECFSWPYAVDNNGYGVVTIDGRPQRVHVLACEHANGPRPSGMHAAHGPCHRPNCWSPRHLRWATPVENMADKVRDGTSRKGERKRSVRAAGVDHENLL